MSIRETDLYLPVKSWLEGHGYSVYAEIQSKRGNRADVVGVKEDNSSAIVELKTSMSTDLIDQILMWQNRHAAHRLYVATPARKKPIPEDVLNTLISCGVGILSVSVDGGCEELIASSLHSVQDRYHIIKAITPLHAEMDIQGGHYGGGFLTGYKATIIGVQRYLQPRGSRWTSLDDIMKNCNTHYGGDSRQCLGKALKTFEYSWCEHSVIGRKSHFRYRGQQK